MKGIFIAKWIGLYRNPWTFILMTVMSVGFALIIGGSSVDKEKIPVYTDLEKDTFIMQLLEDNELFVMDFVTENELAKKVNKGVSEYGLHLSEDEYSIMVGVESPSIELVENTLNKVYSKNEQLNAYVAENRNEKGHIYDHLQENQAFTISLENMKNEEGWQYDNDLYPLFGFSLFFVIYTISFTVFQILVEKNTGIWDRIILTPVEKWKMYAA